MAIPLDMYVFGYILVHAPIKWRISPQTSFDVLVSSIVEHTPCGEILGSIGALRLLNFPIRTELEQLPQSFCENITELHVTLASSSMLVYDSLPNLQKLNLRRIYPDQDDYKLYQTLSIISQLKELTLDLTGGVTMKGVQELSLSIARCSTLKYVDLHISNYRIFEGLWPG